jgi:hypothetical protein
MGTHEQCVGATDEWYSPPYLFEALGCEFDEDVAHPGGEFANWIPARSFIIADSLNKLWHGFIWMNPPFGARNAIVPWLEKFVDHGNGIALTPDRTSAPWWQAYARKMDLVLFVSPKIKFIGRNGAQGKSPAQGTSLMALGVKGCEALHNATEAGLGILMVPKNL